MHATCAPAIECKSTTYGGTEKETREAGHGKQIPYKLVEYIISTKIWPHLADPLKLVG